MKTSVNEASTSWDELTPVCPTGSLPARAPLPDGPLLRVAYSPNGDWPRAIRIERDVLIGRRSPNQASRIQRLDVHDGVASRVHAHIQRLPSGKYLIVDQDSTNGTFVNGQRIRQVELETGDVIRAGNSLLVFGEEDRMSALRADADELAPTELPLLIEGATGAGKGVLAQRIHGKSARKGKFIEVNSAQLQGALDDSTLFGHVRGAFTGAERTRAGLLAEAQGGTLFLDEFAELPAETQVKILHAVEKGVFRPVGGNQVTSVNVRFIGATNADLAQEVRRGRMRLDLVRRFAQPVLSIPALSERRGDIPELMLELSREIAINPFDGLSVTCLESLLLMPFPGNARDVRHLLVRLKNFGPDALERFVADRAHNALDSIRVRMNDRTASSTADSGSMPVHRPPERSSPSSVIDLLPPTDLQRIGVDDACEVPNGVDRTRLGRALAEAGGNVVRAAQCLGVSRRHFYRLLERHRIRVADFRGVRKR